eukprot:13084200-Heterocapsa_arctica.AAC.1
MQQAGFVHDPAEEAWTARTATEGEAFGWEVVPGFKEVDAELLRGERWRTRAYGAWKFSENILILEARALVLSLGRIALSRFGVHIRQLLL